MSTYFSYKKPEDLKVGDEVYYMSTYSNKWFKLRLREFYPISRQILLEFTDFAKDKRLVDYHQIKQFPSNE